MGKLNVAKLNIGSLEPIEEEFCFGGKKYVVCEASEAAASAWSDAARPSMGENGAGVITTAVQLPLIAACLFEVADGRRRPVTVEELHGWPVRVVRGLFAWVTTSSVPPEEDAKNSPPATPGTSASPES